MSDRAQCKHESTKFVLTPKTIHHGKTVCDKCGKFIKWVAKPAKEKTRTKGGPLSDEITWNKASEVLNGWD